MDTEKLAILGGKKAVHAPLPTRGNTDHREKDAVMALFDEAIATGNAIGYNGPQEEAFGKEFAEHMGGGYADGVNSGTNSVFVALRSLDPKPFSEVIVGAITDPGGVSPILACCCIPAFADSQEGQYNTSAAEIEKMITPLTSAIIVPHIGGEAADMRAIMALANKHGIPVVEDCSQAHGATLDGQLVGTFGTVAAFSTMFGKHIHTGGQGGVVYTQDEAHYWKIRQIADRGKPFGLPAGSTNCVSSINHNMDELGACIGRVQLTKLATIVEGRREVARKLAEGFKDIPSVAIPALTEGAEGSYWFWRMGVNLDGLSCTKAEYCAALEAEGVPLVASYKGALPQHMDWFINRRAFGEPGFPWNAPQYTGTMDREFPTPNAIRVMELQYNLMMHEGWTDETIAQVLSAYRKVDAAYRK